MHLIDNKYIPLPDIFKQKGYTLTKIHDFGDDWCVFRRSRAGGHDEFELVKLIKSEEYQLGGNTIPAKISYPGDSQFGRTGFSCVSFERAKQKYNEIQQNKQKRNAAH